MPLADTPIRNAQPKEKQYKLSDGKGLYLPVKKSGKYFRFDYRYAGKRKTIALGVYPGMTLAEARDNPEDARKMLKNGTDPLQAKKGGASGNSVGK